MTQPTDDLRGRRLPRGRHGLPRELVERSQRERLLAAVVRVTAAKGYAETTVADVLEASAVGRETFYELFDDKRDCFLAAHTILMEDLLARGTEAFEQPGPWPERARQGLAAILEWFASDPDVARVLMVEVAAAGTAAQDRFWESFQRVTAILDKALEESDLPSDSASGLTSSNISSIAAGGVYARIYEEVLMGRTAELPELLPKLTYQLLVPFLGEEGAKEEERKARA
jgi:AcrR family transcriptional regulator